MKNIFSYKAYIFDMDGTLYFKRPMQLRMAWQLGRHYLFRLRSLKELLALQKYRQLREREDITGQPGFEQVIRTRLAEEFSLAPEQVDAVVDTWLLRRPLEAVAHSRDRQLLALIRGLQQQGRQVYVYSDYPAEDKCRVLGLCPNGIYWPDGTAIRCMKPEPGGLQHILAENGLSPEEVLFIGDRPEKDGKCAAAVGADSRILPGSARRRKKLYREWLG